MADYNEHERRFMLHPVGVKYICEFCNEGEMQVSNDPIHDKLLLGTRPFITHKCTKCGKTLQLPRSYPYVQFMTDDEYNKFTMNTIIPNNKGKDDIDDTT